MVWKKKGLIFYTNKNYQWMQSHAQLPITYKVNDEILRIYFNTRDTQGRSLPTYIEVESDNPKNVLYIHDRPLLDFGEIGTFDDNGIMVSSIVKVRDKVYMYYIGWSPQITVSYRLAVGLAVSEDGGITFSKKSKGPIVDRCMNDPFFVTAPNVIVDENKFKMWYTSCTGWKVVNSKAEPMYLIKYAESEDGLYWDKYDEVCINYEYDGEAICCPWVIKEENLYKMWFSKRGSVDYRCGQGEHYKIGYAESDDGLNWTRKDNKVGIDISSEGWDSEMIAYGCIYKHQNKKYMFYNGNGFGKTGIGYAIWK